jgi:LDH2 family malate/lactate/ureidoglycolate dehydrogenase
VLVAVTGSPIARDSHCNRYAAGGVGHLLLAIQPEFFLERAFFDTAVEILCSHIKSTPPAADAEEVFLPGELGWRTHEPSPRLSQETCAFARSSRSFD